ncbi:MAG: hypothetical protein WC333_04850 [Dehalococcoidia bacterium]
MQGCESCNYFTDDGKCLARKRITGKQREQGCESFIDKEFQPQVSGCCGIYNMPKGQSPEDTWQSRGNV